MQYYFKYILVFFLDFAMAWLGFLCAAILPFLVLGGLTEPEFPKSTPPKVVKSMECSYANNTADCSWANLASVPNQNLAYNVTSLFLNNNRFVRKICYKVTFFEILA